jgi:hypothetical protein
MAPPFSTFGVVSPSIASGARGTDKSVAMTAFAFRMRTAIAICAAALASACATPPPDDYDNLIVAGERVGPVKIGMPVAELLTVAGTPNSTSLIENSAAATYRFNGFTVAAHDTVYWIVVESPAYRTAQGTAVGVEQIEARASFGKPACVVTRGDHTLYDYENIYVEVSNTTGRVTRIGVQKKTSTCD